MRISDILLNSYKRFTDLSIIKIPSTAKVVLLIGPNGSGKTSVFEAMITWYKLVCYGNSTGDYIYYIKGHTTEGLTEHVNLENHISINFHGLVPFMSRHPQLRGELKSILTGKFYFRSAYRHEADFTSKSINRLENPAGYPNIGNFLQSDQTVHLNYQRIIGKTIAGVFGNKEKTKTVEELKNEIIQKINESLINVFDDLELVSLGDPLSNGSFYFKKGASNNFHYKNLSAGEKSAFDVILDLVVKKEYYGGAVYCIDEPETHMHTKLQSRLFRQMYNIIPEEGQLWLSTHSLGILKEAKSIEDKYPGTIAFLDFDNKNFDEKVEIQPSSIDKAIWQKFVDITLDDFSTIIAPKKVIFCEGDPKGTKNKNFDAQVYSKIFGNYYPEISFVSIGSSNDLHNEYNVGILAIKQVLKNVDYRIVTDRDDKSPEEVAESADNRISVLTERHLESYLLDDEIIIKLCLAKSQYDLVQVALNIKTKALSESAARGNPDDDVKSAAPVIYQNLTKTLKLIASGNNTESFLRDTMAPLITPETNVYQRLRKDVLGL